MRLLFLCGVGGLAEEGAEDGEGVEGAGGEGVEGAVAEDEVEGGVAVVGGEVHEMEGGGCET